MPDIHQTREMNIPTAPPMCALMGTSLGYRVYQDTHSHLARIAELLVSESFWLEGCSILDVVLYRRSPVPMMNRKSQCFMSSLGPKTHGGCILNFMGHFLKTQLSSGKTAATSSLEKPLSFVHKSWMQPVAGRW